MFRAGDNVDLTRPPSAKAEARNFWASHVRRLCITANFLLGAGDKCGLRFQQDWRTRERRTRYYNVTTRWFCRRIHNLYAVPFVGFRTQIHCEIPSMPEVVQSG